MAFFMENNCSQALEQSVNEFTVNYGVTDVAKMYNAAVSVAEDVKNVCLPLVMVAFTFIFLGQMTKWVLGEKELNLMRFGRFLLLLLCLVNYGEILAQVNGIIAYFSNAIGPSLGNYGSGLSLTGKVNKLLEFNRNKADYSIFKDGLSNILDWLVANCSHLIIIVSRAVIYCIRELYLMFLMATGPIAVLLSMFPWFEKTLDHWLKAYLSAGCWALTMGVLDRILNTYLDRMLESHDGQGLIVMNIGIALMYLMVPYLTSKYIGAVHSQFMGKMSAGSVSVMRLGTQLDNGLGGMMYSINRKTIDGEEAGMIEKMRNSPLAPKSARGTFHAIPRQSDSL
jgi:hypothetical protein